jgi:hypothetical protein
MWIWTRYDHTRTTHRRHGIENLFASSGESFAVGIYSHYDQSRNGEDAFVEESLIRFELTYRSSVAPGRGFDLDLYASCFLPSHPHHQCSDKVLMGTVFDKDINA